MFIVNAIRPLASGLRLFAINAVVQSLFISVEWWENYGFSTRGSVDDFWPTVLVLTVLYPGLFTAAVLCLMLVVKRTRRLAFGALTCPSGLLALALFGAGAALAYGVGQTVIGYTVAWAGAAVASVTQFEIEERGPQPWLGFPFLAIAFMVGLSIPVSAIAADDQPSPAPESALGWVVLALNGLLLGAAAVRHWRRHQQPLATP